jgi:hypothetical protein
MVAHGGAAGGPATLGWRLQRDAGGDDVDVEHAPSSTPAPSDPEIEVTFEEPPDDWPGNAPDAPPAPVLPIPVPLPLVSPPPLEPAREPAPRSLAPRRAKAAVAGACIVAGLAATFSLLLAKGPAVPSRPATAPATIHAAPAAPVAAEPPAIAADPPAPQPDVAPPASASAKASPAPRRARCRILNGEPCF